MIKIYNQKFIKKEFVFHKIPEAEQLKIIMILKNIVMMHVQVN